MQTPPPSAPIGVEIFQSLTEIDRKTRSPEAAPGSGRWPATHSDEIEMFCAHDRHELDRLRSAAG